MLQLKCDAHLLCTTNKWKKYRRDVVEPGPPVCTMAVVAVAAAGGGIMGVRCVARIGRSACEDTAATGPARACGHVGLVMEVRCSLLLC